MVDMPKATGATQAQQRRAEQLARVRHQTVTLLDTLLMIELPYISPGTLQSILHILLAITNTITIMPTFEATRQHLSHSCHYLRQLITAVEEEQDLTILQHCNEQCCQHLTNALDGW